MRESQKRRQSDKESGASLVELAMIAPLLLLLLIGVMEFAWVFSQHLDVRQGTREATRLAIVNYPAGTDQSSGQDTVKNTEDLVAEVCARMDDATDATVSIAATVGPSGETAGHAGSLIQVTVAKPGTSLTDLLNWALPPDLSLQASAEGRVLYPATWANTDSTTEKCP
jgi:Flp pilus assembly protein TadG